MQFNKNGITVSVGDTEVERIVLERLNGPEIYLPSAEIVLDPAPRIGEAWQGGIYAGVARERPGTAITGDYYLIVGPEYDGDVDWNASVAWAKALDIDGFRDWGLPTRKEQALCFANVPELFESRAYWSCEQHAPDSYDAWFQSFSNGYQYYWDEGIKLRARAVRRLPIQ